MPDDLDTASEALGAWQEGARTGDWSKLIGMLGGDACVTMPFGGSWKGQKTGSAIRELFRHASEDLQIRLDQQPVGDFLDNGGGRFAWELVGEGTVGGKPAQVPICIWFTVRSGRVTAIREYVGNPAG